MTNKICQSVDTPSNGIGTSNVTIVNTQSAYDTAVESGTTKSIIPQKTLYDLRGKDGSGTTASPKTDQTYIIRKLADGNCWMVQNLYMTLSTSTTLTSDTTDVTSDWTPNKNTESSAGGKWGTGSAWNDASQITDTEINTHHSYNGNGSGSAGTQRYVTDADGNTQDIGVYYNWAAAIASRSGTSTAAASITSGEAPESICPKGWELPRNADDKSWYKLLFTTYGLSDNSSDSNNYVRQTPLSFAYTGYYYWVSGAPEGLGTYGLWWSATAVSRTNGRDLDMNTTPRLIPQNSNVKAYGFAVRCVAK